jgi:hypothetical protein
LIVLYRQLFAFIFISLRFSFEVYNRIEEVVVLLIGVRVGVRTWFYLGRIIEYSEGNRTEFLRRKQM